MTVTQVVLDPPEIAADRTDLDLNAGPIRVEPDGVDWGEAAIEAFMAQQSRGETPVDFRVPNRKVTIPLTLGADGASGYELARSQLRAKVALFQREGGWLRRGDDLFADVVNATLTLPDRYGHLGAEVDVVLTLEVLPDLYGDEVAHGEHSGTGGLTFSEITAGDFPKRTRIVVTNTSGQAQRGLLWGFRCRHFSGDATAALFFEAEDLEPLDTATVAALTGASGGDVVKHANLATGWTPVLGTKIGGTADLTHTGTYRVWARVYSTDEDVQARFVWDVGDLTLPVENRAFTIPQANGFYLADLGEIRLDPVPVGDHRWRGQVQAKGTSGGEELQVDRLMFQPLDEGAGRLVAPMDPNLGLSSFTARDEFNQTAGNLAGKTASVGGAWAGAGDSDDFVLETSDNTVKRTAVSDTARRLETVGSALSATAVQADFRTNNPLVFPDPPRQGVIARYVDANNYLVAWAEPGPLETELRVAKVIGGVETILSTTSGGRASAGIWYTLRLAVLGGQWFLWEGLAGSSLSAPVTGYDSALTGTLSGGKAGLYDYQPNSTAVTRGYNNFFVWAPIDDAVLFPMQAAELRTDGMVRKDPSGAAFGPVSFVVGDLPRLPPSGLEARPAEVFLLTSRGDFDQLPDSGLDSFSARIYSRPTFIGA